MERRVQGVAGSSAPVAVAALGLVLALSACSGDRAGAAERKKAATRAVPVVVATVERRTVPLRIEAIGNVEPYATVAVKSRVDGQIVGVYFRDGDEVKKGQRLFQLDPRSFQAAVAQSEAALARDRARLENARIQERRYKDLLAKNFASKDTYAQYRTNVDTLRATLRADAAAVDTAKLQLEYATIRSPIDGRTGRIMIQLGNLVKANDTTPLVVINRLSPIYLSFSIPEQYLQETRRYMAAGKLPVEARLPDPGGGKAEGVLDFIDNTVDPTTGTVKLRAVFPNRNRFLWPGQFVTASLTLHEQKDALVVPAQAVQTGPKGRFVFVIKDDLTAEVRPVTVDRTDAGETIIAKGVAPGERVVINGQVRLVPGIKVALKTEKPAS